MEGFSFVTSVTGLSRPNTGKEDDDDEMTTGQKLHKIVGLTFKEYSMKPPLWSSG
jgi:hypothetical protein